MGTKRDLMFGCTAPVQQVSSQHYITVGLGQDKKVHMVRLEVRNSGRERKYELRSIQNYGKLRKNDVF